MTGTDDPSAGSPDRSAGEGTDEALPQESAWQRRRRLAAVFGEVLPETTGDERDPEAGADDSEEWLRRQVPPHHG